MLRNAGKFPEKFDSFLLLLKKLISCRLIFYFSLYYVASCFLVRQNFTPPTLIQMPCIYSSLLEDWECTMPARGCATSADSMFPNRWEFFWYHSTVTVRPSSKGTSSFQPSAASLVQLIVYRKSLKQRSGTKVISDSACAQRTTWEN